MAFSSSSGLTPWTPWTVIVISQHIRFYYLVSRFPLFIFWFLAVD